MAKTRRAVKKEQSATKPGPSAPAATQQQAPITEVSPPAASAIPAKVRPEAPVDTGRKFRVTATKIGYIDHIRRRPGDVFDVTAAEFSANWMEPVDGSTPPKTTGAQAALEAQRQSKLSAVIADKAAGKSTGDKSVI